MFIIKAKKCPGDESSDHALQKKKKKAKCDLQRVRIRVRVNMWNIRTMSQFILDVSKQNCPEHGHSGKLIEKMMELVKMVKLAALMH